MQAHLVPRGPGPANDFRVTPDAAAHHEKRGTSTVPGKNIQDPARVPGTGSVVERDCEAIRDTLDTTKQVRDRRERRARRGVLHLESDGTTVIPMRAQDHARRHMQAFMTALVAFACACPPCAAQTDAPSVNPASPALLDRAGIPRLGVA